MEADTDAFGAVGFNFAWTEALAGADFGADLGADFGEDFTGLEVCGDCLGA